MSVTRALAADHAAVFAHFGAEQVSEHSVYLWSPVFSGLIGGRPAVIKRFFWNERRWHLRVHLHLVYLCIVLCSRHYQHNYPSS